MIEDLGELTTAQDRVKALIAAGNMAAVDDLEDRIVNLTCEMVAAGVVDSDHSMLNLMVTPAERLVRIDFELARCVRHPSRHPRQLGRMVGRLIASYAFTLQPDVRRAESLAVRLAERLSLSARALREVHDTLAGAMERQRRNQGIETTVRLPA